MLPRFIIVFVIPVVFGSSLISGYTKAASAETKLYVKDGDSFVLGDQEIRLWGIDAVELLQFCWKNDQKYPCGRQAREYLISLIKPNELKCHEKPRAKSETRTVAQCFVNDNDLAELMVRGGWAVDYSYFSKGFYRASQDQARKEKKGIWAGELQIPREWRKTHKY